MTLTVPRDNQAIRGLHADLLRSRPTVEQLSKGYRPGDESIRLAVEQQVMGGLDADQDGGVSFDELAKAGKAGASPADLAARRAFFSQGDKDGNGVLSQTELRSTSLFDNDSLAALIGAQDAGGVGQALVGRADTDGDGKLSAREYAGIAADSTRGTGRFVQNKAGEYRAVWDMTTDAEAQTEDFARFDADKDGLLSADEISANFNARINWSAGEAAPVAEVVDYLAKTADGDGDGALSLDEIKAAAGKAGLQDFDAASLIDDGDTDGDGLLSRTELQGLHWDKAGMAYSGSDISAGQISLSRLGFAVQRDFGRTMSADLGMLAAPPLRDPDAVAKPYAAGDALSVRDAAAMNSSGYYDLRANYDKDEDGVLSADEFAEAASKTGLSTLNLAGMIGALDTDHDGKLSGDEVNRLANQWRAAAYRGEATKLSALSEGEASLANLLLSVQHGPWAASGDETTSTT